MSETDEGLWRVGARRGIQDKYCYHCGARYLVVELLPGYMKFKCRECKGTFCLVQSSEGEGSDRKGDTDTER